MAARLSTTTGSGSGPLRSELADRSLPAEFGADCSAVRSEVTAIAAIVNDVEPHRVGYLGRQCGAGVGAEVAFPNAVDELRQVRAGGVGDLNGADVLRQIVDEARIHRNIHDAAIHQPAMAEFAPNQLPAPPAGNGQPPDRDGA